MTRITTYDAIRMAAALTGIPAAEIRGSRRSARYIHARAAVVILMRRRGRSLPGIGAALGGRDHSTIVHLFQCYHQRQEVLDLVALIEAAVAINPPWHGRHLLSSEAVAHA